jgi:hypothetical protein
MPFTVPAREGIGDADQNVVGMVFILGAEITGSLDPKPSKPHRQKQLTN